MYQFGCVCYVLCDANYDFFCFFLSRQSRACETLFLQSPVPAPMAPVSQYNPGVYHVTYWQQTGATSPNVTVYKALKRFHSWAGSLCLLWLTGQSRRRSHSLTWTLSVSVPKTWTPVVRQWIVTLPLDSWQLVRVRQLLWCIFPVPSCVTLTRRFVSCGSVGGVSTAAAPGPSHPSGTPECRRPIPVAHWAGCLVYLLFPMLPTAP